ncbi:GTPase Era [Feifania hominis]|uniref:GTPase Era n=1 Tax=Feifania hominis TaxID=2763660 RepID=A0A926DCB8_9FIRM|nr:GTPase Era [Feifania hominis]MBC8535483.1 GTPase Era [Feifania hominis]
MEIKKSGFVSLVGRPNVGKSTLVNALVGEKVAIVSPKPQTTRNRILAILTTDDTQVVFVDTPGMHRPRTRLGNYMVRSAESSLRDVDAVLFVVEPNGKIAEIEQQILARLVSDKLPAVLVINKVDRSTPELIAKTIMLYRDCCDFRAVVPISALKNDGVDIVRDEILALMPQGPQYFPEDELTDQPERQMVAEIIREKALGLLDQEVPHGIAVEIVQFREREDGLVSISATIYCERESHKGIIIGRGGKTLKAISSRARADIERLLDTRVYLETFVKVKENWRDSDYLIRNFGYDDRRDG